MTDLLKLIERTLPADAIVSSSTLADRASSYWDPSPTEAQCLLRPGTTAQLSAVMRICHEKDQTVVVQGGLTGVVEGAKSTGEDVIISLERMNRIESVDAMARRAQGAGCPRRGPRLWLAKRGSRLGSEKSHRSD